MSHGSSSWRAGSWQVPAWGKGQAVNGSRGDVNGYVAASKPHATGVETSLEPRQRSHLDRHGQLDQPGTPCHLEDMPRSFSGENGLERGEGELRRRFPIDGGDDVALLESGPRGG